VNDECAFYKRMGEREFCAYTNKKRICWICSDFLTRNSDLEMKDLYILNEGRRGRRLTLAGVFFSLLFSLLSLSVSVVKLLFDNNQ
jgi:hypothetical protein